MRSKQEQMTKMLLIDSIIAIQEETHPRILEETLKPYLNAKKRQSAKKE